MRKLTDAEILQINGSGSETYNLPGGATVTTTQMPNKSTTATFAAGEHSVSLNSGQQLVKFVTAAGVTAMAAPFLSPIGSFAVGQAASFGVGKLMNSVADGA